MKKIKVNWNTALVAVILCELIIFGAKNPKFLNISSMVRSLNDFMPVGIIGIFVTLVMITGGIDIQAGSIVGLTSILIGVMWQDLGVNIWVACILALVIAALCGALSGYFIAYCGVQAMVATLGGSFLYAGLALMVSTLSDTPAYMGITNFPDAFRAITKFKIGTVSPGPVLVFVIIAIIMGIVLHKTKYGRKIFLVGVNQNAGEFAGINTRLIILSTYVLSAIGAAVSGILLTSYYNVAKSDLGSTFTMNIITVVVLGGTLSTGGKGNIFGTVCGTLIIGLIKFGLPLCFGINAQYLDAPIGILLVVVLLGRALVVHPAFIDYQAKLKNKRKQSA
jgi:AI-2 transport system permease protein